MFSNFAILKFVTSFPCTGIVCMHMAHCASTISNASDFQQCKISDGLVPSGLSGVAHICTTNALFLQQKEKTIYPTPVLVQPVCNIFFNSDPA